MTFNACVPSVRCADRTLCPGPCREAGNREGNQKLPTNPTPDELERYRNAPHRRTT